MLCEYVCECMYLCVYIHVCTCMCCLMISTESSGVNALQENLRKTQIELERAQSAEAHAKTGKKRMEAQLKESYR